MNPLVYALSLIINTYIFIVFAAVIMQLLLQFRVLNLGNKLVYTLNHMLRQMTDPVFDRIRRIIPPLGGTLDLSPLIVLIALQVLDYSVHYYLG